MSDLLPHHIHALSQQIPQLEDEPTIEYMAFLNWVNLGMPSARAMESVTRFSEASIVSWRGKWDWKRRLNSSPVAQQSQLTAQRIQQMIGIFESETKASARVMKLIERTVTKLFIADTLSSAPVAGARDLAALLRAVHEYERLEANQSTHNVAVSMPQIDREALDAMSADELLVLRRALPALLQEEDDEGSSE